MTNNTVISLYCHFTGYSIVKLVRNDKWTVERIIHGKPSYNDIEKNLKDVIGANYGQVLINSDIQLSGKLHSNFRFKQVILSMSENRESYFNQMFHAIACFNDKLLLFNKEDKSVIELIQLLSFFNMNVHSNDLNALVIALSEIKIAGMRNLLGT